MNVADFEKTRLRIQPHLRSTPLVPTDWPELFLKLENLQTTHSFKIRGAFARVLDLVEQRDSRTILTVSAGNHGQAIARAASTFHLPCTVVVPASAPRAKVNAIRKYGVTLRVEGSNYDEAEAFTLRLAERRDEYVFVSPYNDRHVILGQGTLALDILEQKPGVATILVPVGGGGLAAGVSAAVKQLQPAVRVVGVQAEVSAAIYHSLKAGRLVTIPDRPSLADGIQGNVEPESITFPIIQKYIDEIVVVPEAAIRSAMLLLLRQEKIVAEGAAAVGVAAFLQGKVDSKGPIVEIITGGNVDLEKIL